jgi:hypothetical protein
MTAAPHISDDERAHAIRLLRDSEREFLELVSGLTEAQWTAPAALGQWTIQQTAEHIVMGELTMLDKIAEALANPPNPDWEEQDARKTGFIGRVIPDRGRKATAPAGLEPHRRWTLEETIARYKKGRARTLKFAEEADRPLKHHLAEHPFPVFNSLNAYHWLLYIPLHNVRHNRQIAEAVRSFVP